MSEDYGADLCPACDQDMNNPARIRELEAARHEVWMNGGTGFIGCAEMDAYVADSDSSIRAHLEAENRALTEKVKDAERVRDTADAMCDAAMSNMDEARKYADRMAEALRYIIECVGPHPASSISSEVRCTALAALKEEG